MQRNNFFLINSACKIHKKIHINPLINTVRNYAILDRLTTPKKEKDILNEELLKEEELELKARKAEKIHAKIMKIERSKLNLKKPSAEDLYNNLDVPVSPEGSKVLNIAIIGQPNSGKSTLINRIVQNRISSVSSKPQTTRKQIIGILNEREVQLIFIDTPGISDWKEMRSTETWGALDSADLILVVVDCVKTVDFSIKQFFQRIAKYKEMRNSDPKRNPVKYILFLNKYDKYLHGAFSGDIYGVKERFSYKIPDIDNIFDLVLHGSALIGIGINDLKQEIKSNAIPGKWEYSALALTDQSRVELANEIIREKIYRHLNNEIPYHVKQKLEYWTEDPRRGYLRIDEKLYVPKASHIKMILGRSGSTLRAMCDEASRDIGTLFGMRVIVKMKVIKARKRHSGTEELSF